MREFDQTYRENPDYFGVDASPLLQRFSDRIPAKARVLDVGAGNGRNCLPLARSGCQVTAIDTSGVSIEVIGKVAAERNLDVKLWQGDFMDFEASDAPFDAVLCFGLLQILDRSHGSSLVHRLRAWTRPGGVLFLTAWHIGDPSFVEASRTWDRIGLNSYQNREGEVWTFLENDEILDLLNGWEIVHHFEGLGPLHAHPGEPPMQHGVVEVVGVRG
jgi:SAM-dependent methyltransferase